MKTVMRILLVVTIGIVLSVGTGCVPAKTVWKSTPGVQKAANKLYTAKIEPLRKEADFYVSFLFQVTNKTQKSLEVDWNKTRYLLNGKAHGGFVFRGIKPKDIKNATIPPDIVPPNGTFSKSISPFKMLARAPIGDRSTGMSSSEINPGILPNGKNGMLLVVRQEGKEIVEKLTIIITERTVQP